MYIVKFYDPQKRYLAEFVSVPEDRCEWQRSGDLRIWRPDGAWLEVAGEHVVHLSEN